MTKAEIVKKVEELNEWETLMEQAKEAAEEIKDSLKAELLERETEELIADKYIIRWTSVVSNKFNTAEFKKLYSQLYKSFTKEVSSRRFSIAC